MKVIKMLRANLSSPKNDIKIIKDELSFIQREMISISKMDNRVEAVVRLFKAITPFQDKGELENVISKLRKKNYGQIDHMVNAFETFQKQLKDLCEYPNITNTTQKGEVVTADKIFIGGINYKEPASYWLECNKKYDTEDGIYTSERFSFPSKWYWVHDCYAEHFVVFNTKGILEKIIILKNAI